MHTNTIYPKVFKWEACSSVYGRNNPVLSGSNAKIMHNPPSDRAALHAAPGPAVLTSAAAEGDGRRPRSLCSSIRAR